MKARLTLQYDSGTFGEYVHDLPFRSLHAKYWAFEQDRRTVKQYKHWKKHETRYKHYMWDRASLSRDRWMAMSEPMTYEWVNCVQISLAVKKVREGNWKPVWETPELGRAWEYNRRKQNCVRRFRAESPSRILVRVTATVVYVGASFKNES